MSTREDREIDAHEDRIWADQHRNNECPNCADKGCPECHWGYR